MRLLLLDDNPEFVEVCKLNWKKEEDVEIDTAVNPKEALEKAEREDYDAIVSDYQMPELNGLEFLNKVRDMRGDEIPSILLTGRGSEEVAMRAVNQGVDGYVQKGTDFRSQFRKIRDLVSPNVA